MPVPKRKTSKARRDQRSSTWFIRPQSVSLCFNGACEGEPKLPHQVCLKCGFYKGKKVIVTKQDRELKRAEVRKAIAARKGTAQGASEKSRVQAPALETIKEAPEKEEKE